MWHTKLALHGGDVSAVTTEAAGRDVLGGLGMIKYS
jgi:hypothetical protein